MMKIGCLSISGLFVLLLALLGVPAQMIVVTQSFEITVPASSSLSACLPDHISLTDVVSVSPGGANRITVQQTLDKLGASCGPNNILIDQSGKPITFYHLTGCWGNQPANYEELLKKQNDTIAKLSEQYTVIQMTCNPSGRLLY